MSGERGGSRPLDALEEDIRDTRRRIGGLLDGLDGDHLLRPSLHLALRAARQGAAPTVGAPGFGLAVVALAAALAGFAAAMLRRRPGGVPAAEKKAAPAKQDAAQ